MFQVGDVVALKSSPRIAMTISAIDQEGVVACVIYLNDSKKQIKAELPLSTLGRYERPALGVVGVGRAR
jgi:uncharacterized protein YodC (DUF2158 family)